MHGVFRLFFFLVASTGIQIQVPSYEIIGWIATEVEILNYLRKLKLTCCLANAILPSLFIESAHKGVSLTSCTATTNSVENTRLFHISC